MLQDNWNERSPSSSLMRSKDDCWLETRRSSFALDMEFPRHAPYVSTHSASLPLDYFSLTDETGSKSRPTFLTSTLLIPQHNLPSRPLRPLRSCMKSVSSQAKGRGNSTDGRKNVKRQVTFVFPDGRREPARPQSIATFASSALDNMRNFFLVAFGVDTLSQSSQVKAKLRKHKMDKRCALSEPEIVLRRRLRVDERDMDPLLRRASFARSCRISDLDSRRFSDFGELSRHLYFD